jgi:hypothetical protein
MQTSERECLIALQEAASQLGESPTKAEYEELGLTPASGTIIRVIGGWNEAKERAGLKTNPSRGTRVSSKPDHVDLPSDVGWDELTVNQRWHYRNREWNTERTLQRRSRLRDWVNEQKAKIGCEGCDVTDPTVLDPHHTDGAEKTMALVEMVTYGYRRERLAEELSNCVILCANCHRRAHGKRRDGENTLRGWLDDYKQTRGCANCDESDPRSLVFHHTGEKRQSVSQLVSDGRQREEIEREIEKCDVLCANCHRIVHSGDSQLNG